MAKQRPEPMKKAGEILEKPMLHRVRDNWVDIALPLDLG